MNAAFKPHQLDRLPLHRHFSVRLGIAILAFVVFALAASAYTAIRIAEQGFDRIVREDFQATLGVTENFLNSQAENWTNWAFHLTEDEIDHGLGEVVANRQLDLLKAYIAEKLPSAFAAAVTIIDGNGRVLHRTHLPGKFGDSLGHSEIVRQTLSKGQSGSAIVNDLNQFMLYAAAPIRYRKQIVGVLLIGSAIDDAFVETVKANTGVELAIIRDRAVMGSTLKTRTGDAIGDLPMPYLEYQMMLNAPDQVRETRFLGTRYFVATRPITIMDGNTSIGCYRSEDLSRIRYLVRCSRCHHGGRLSPAVAFYEPTHL